MKYKFKKKWLIVLGIALVFIIGNPSIRKFKSYIYEPKSSDIRREYNFLLFSIYTENKNYDKTYYLGILFNFFNLGTKDTY